MTKRISVVIDDPIIPPEPSKPEQGLTLWIVWPHDRQDLATNVHAYSAKEAAEIFVGYGLGENQLNRVPNVTNVCVASGLGGSSRFSVRKTITYTATPGFDS